VAIRGRKLTLDAGVFFQSNAAMLEALIPDLLAAAEQADTSLPMADIYCGVGTFAAFLQEKFSRIDLVEENTAALTLARENVRGGGRRFFAQKDEAWVRGLTSAGTGKAGSTGMKSEAGSPYGFAVADPPRQGFSPAVRHWLVEEGPPILAYVSCDPATLARDSGVLCRGGYRLETLTFYDFYPQTAHVESLAVFIRDNQ
jgi:23S rRNA (uracil1939-C5)-methyltransferase